MHPLDVLALVVLAAGLIRAAARAARCCGCLLVLAGLAAAIAAVILTAARP
jgi:hypothetical protein